MKLRAPLLQTLLLAAMMVFSASIRAANPPKPAPAPVAAPEPKISGQTLTRLQGGFLGLEIDPNGNFKLSFYDAKKKHLAPDVTSATIRWTPAGKRGIEFALLTPSSDGTALACSKLIQKPWS